MTSRRHDTLERASNHSAFGFCLMNYCWKQRICREYGARCGFAAIFTELSHIDTKHPKLSSKTSEKQNGLDGHCVFSPSTFVTFYCHRPFAGTALLSLRSPPGCPMGKGSRVTTYFCPSKSIIYNSLQLIHPSFFCDI